MRYPDGRNYHRKITSESVATSRKHETQAHRGMRLETMLNHSNEWYLARERAVIYKKPTPIQVVSVDYPKRAKAKIKEAYYRQPSTTDYNGVYNGYYLDFEAKQTAEVTRFPLSNFHEHQIQHMKACQDQGGICFVIMLFSHLNEAYLYPFDALQTYWWRYCRKEGRASIPIDAIRSDGISIAMGAFPDIDYLPAVDQYIKQLQCRGSESFGQK